ncbi:MAG: pyridoxamine 5'-phosphate oxidase family protein [Ilumatobacter sp.]
MEPSENGTEILSEILSETVCWERLRRTSIGRLGVHHEGQPAIYPINYLVDGSSIVFRTRAGSKIYDAPRLERVAFEIDGFDPSHGGAWSVLVKGFGRFVDSAPEIEHADTLALYPWVDVDRSAWVRIVPVEVTGRRFHVVGDAITDGSVGWAARVGG